VPKYLIAVMNNTLLPIIASNPLQILPCQCGVCIERDLTIPKSVKILGKFRLAGFSRDGLVQAQLEAGLTCVRLVVVVLNRC